MYNNGHNESNNNDNDGGTCFLYELKFVFDDRVISPWREKYLVTSETFEVLKNSWGPSSYLFFEVVCKNGESKKTVFINSADVVLFESVRVRKDNHGNDDNHGHND